MFDSFLLVSWRSQEILLEILKKQKKVVNGDDEK